MSNPSSPMRRPSAVMNQGPVPFSEIGKKAKDLLTKDYSYDQKFTFSSYSNAGVGLSSTAVKKGGLPSQKKKGGLSTGDISAQFKYKNTTIHVKVDTKSNISTTLGVSKIAPSTKLIATIKLPDYNSSKISTTLSVSKIAPSTKLIATIKLPDYNSSKVEVQYFHEHATFATAVALSQLPTVDLKCTIGTQAFAIGAEVGYETASGSFTKYNAGISVTKPDSCTSIVLADKADTLKASYVHHLDHLKTVGVAEITRRLSLNEFTFTVGASYAYDPLTVVKTRFNNHGKLGAVLQHELKPKSMLTISGEFDTKALDKNPRIGLALALKP